MNPADFPLGSLQSRVAARTRLDKPPTPERVLRVTVEHIAHDPALPLPPNTRTECGDCVVEIIHRGA